MNRQILITLALLSGLAYQLRAQQLPTRYEYWYDRNFTQRQSGSISGGELSLQCDATGLHEGLHYLNFRVADNDGHWSSVKTKYFLHLPAHQTGQITTYQYWMDGNISQAKTISATSRQELLIDIDPAWLARRGVHSLTLRGQDNLGHWSVTSTKYFLTEPMMSQSDNRIVAYKYWFNDAAASPTIVRLPEPVTPYTLQTEIKPHHLIKEGEVTDDNRTTIVDANGTEHIAAWNKLYIAFQDAAGQWSESRCSQFVAPLAKDYEQMAELSDVALLSVDDIETWHNPGTPIRLTISGHYSHQEGQSGNVYYRVDDEQPIRIDRQVAANTDFTAQISCVFRAGQALHNLKFYAEDPNEMSSDTVLIEIPDMNRCWLINVPTAMTYTGNALLINDLAVYDYQQILSEGQHYTLSYANNVNDGQASVTALGVFPRYIGKSQTQHFDIHSVIDADEVALLQRLQQETGYTRWNLEAPVYSDQLYGVEAYNQHITRISAVSQELTGTMPNYLFQLPALQKLDLSYQNLSGAIDHTKISPVLTELSLEYNRLSELTGVLPKTITTLRLYGQQPEGEYSLHTSQLVDGSYRAQLPNIIFYDHERQSFAPDYKQFELRYDDGKEQFDIYDYEGRMSLTLYTDLTFANDASLSLRDEAGNSLACCFGYDMGDANLDGEFNVLDLSTLVPRAMGNRSRYIHISAADLWTDQTLNVQDVVGLVNLLLDSDQYSHAAARHASERDMEPQAEPAATILLTGNRLMLCCDKKVSAFDIVIDGLMGDSRFVPEAELQGLSLSTRVKDGKLHLVGYTSPSQLIPEGSHTLGVIEGTANPCSIAYALLADHDAQPICPSFQQPTPLTPPMADGQKHWYLYTTSGQLMAHGTSTQEADACITTLRQGLYILLQQDEQGITSAQKIQVNR